MSNSNIYFSTCLPYSFKHLSYLSTTCEFLMKRTMLATDCWLHGQVVLHQQHFLDHEWISYTKSGFPLSRKSGNVRELSGNFAICQELCFC